MRFFIYPGLLILIALLTGFSLSYEALDQGRMFATFRQGAWLSWKDVGAPQPDPYSRAYGAQTGALFLTQAEGIRFVAKQDSDGQALMGNCAYRVDGTTPVSAFWTLVATNMDDELINQKATPPAIDSRRLARNQDGSFLIRVSPRLAAGNWLETNGASKNFKLVLTLYDSDMFSGLGSPGNKLPAILREGCQ